MKTFKLLLIPLLFLQTFCFAQEENELVPSTFSIAINQDNAFGFYPAMYGSFGLSDELSFTYYGLFWTNPSYGNFVSGTDNWLEAGIGLSFSFLEDRVLFNPSIGTVHGKLLSDAREAKVMEGIVPSIATFYLDDRFEAELFFAWYKGLKSEGPNAGDYLLYWILPGVFVHPNISLGLHYESFVNSRIAEGEAGTLYQWFGGYAKFTVADKYSFRFSAGKNTGDVAIYSDQFYKLSIVIPLL